MFSVTTLPGYTPLSQPAVVASAAGQSTRRNSPPLPAAKPTELAATDRGAAWVATDDDVAEYFARYGSAAQQQFFYAVKADESSTEAAFDLAVVPQERLRNAQHYFILSERQVVKIDRRSGEHTDTVPLAEWMAHKRAFRRLRQLTFFGCFSLAKCFCRWRCAARHRVVCRRRHQLQQSLFLGWPSFQAALLEAGTLLEQLRAVRAVKVQPGRLCTAADWAEQQGNWRSRRAQPEMEAAAAQLVRVAEGVCAQAEATAQHMLDSVRPSELEDRIGVDLFAATSKAKARSMQQIKQDKVAKAAAYHQALAERGSLPRFLRMLDLRLAGALADMAVDSAADAASALHAAAPGVLQQARELCELETDADEDDEVDGLGRASNSGSGGSSSRPAFFCSLAFAPDGNVGFTPSEAEWTAAVEAEAVSSGLRMAGSLPGLLTLPAFEQYQVQLHAAAAAERAPAGDGEEQPTGAAAAAAKGAAELAQQDGVFVGAAGEMREMLHRSFAKARQLAQQYQQYHAIQAFGQEWDFEAWAAGQRAAPDLEAMEAMLAQLQQWQQQLEGMPLARTAGLLHIDATELQASLQPVVASAQERVGGLLLQLAGEKCRQQLNELAMWLEVAAARPAELEGFLPWAAELAHMQQEQGRLLAEAASADAALELVVRFAGKLPTAEAVKKDDLREAATKLPAELAAAAAWRMEQRPVHAAAVAEQARALSEEAIILESEMTIGIYVDADAASSEVLAELEMQQSRVAQLVAQAEGLAGLQEELGEQAGTFEEVRGAEAALKRCTEMWSLVAEAEVLQASLAGGRSCSKQEAQPAEEDGQPVGQAGGGCTPAKLPEDASGQLLALLARLGELRGDSTAGPPDAIWLRANGVLRTCSTLLFA